MSSIVPRAVTQPFFEIQIPDFTKKFIWTVPTNLEQKISQWRQKGRGGQGH